MPIKKIILCFSILMGILSSSQYEASACFCSPDLEEDISEIELDNSTSRPLHIGDQSVQMQRQPYDPNETIYKTLRPSNLTPPEVSVKLAENYRYTDFRLPQPSMQTKHIGAVIGKDDRIRVRNTSAYPNSAHGYLEMTYPNGKRFIGTGTMIQSHHVLTAAHNLYNASRGGWVSSVKFTAARNENYSPFPTAYATHLITVKGYAKYDTEGYDYALVTLDRDLGYQTGWLGLIDVDDEVLYDLSVNVTGYPGDKKRAAGGLPQMWTMAGSIYEVSPEQYTYTLDTNKGQSGSGVWSKFTIESGRSEYYCSGVHVSGRKDVINTATRISVKKFNNLIEWMNKW